MESVKKLRLGDKAIPIIIAIIAVAIVGIIATVVHKKQDKVETQRTARVVEVNGPCSILREGATINAVADMPLYSGDTFFSGVNASARIMVDDDKFLYLDAATRINFTASGTPDDTHTMIYVETGSMFTEVKEQLAEGESFDIVTPNTISSIHGTWVLTQVIPNWDGSVTTLTGLPEGRQSTVVIENTLRGLSSLPIPLNVGDAVAITTPANNLAVQADLTSIASSGESADGKAVENASAGDMASETGAAAFGEDFLSNCQQVSVRNNTDYAKANNLSDSSAAVQQENAAAVEGNNVIEVFKQGESNIPAEALQLSEQGDSDDETPAPGAADNSDSAQPAQPVAEEPAVQPAGNDDEDEEPSQPPVAQPQHVPGPGEDGYLGYTREEQILAVEAAIAQVNANNQAAAQAEAERLAQEQAAREAAERASQNSGGGSSGGSGSSSDSGPSKDPEPTPAVEPSPAIVEDDTPSTDDTRPTEESTPAEESTPTGDVSSTDDPHQTETTGTPNSESVPRIEETLGGEFAGYAENGFPLYVTPEEPHYLYYVDEGEIIRYEGEIVSSPQTTN